MPITQKVLDQTRASLVSTLSNLHHEHLHDLSEISRKQGSHGEHSRSAEHGREIFKAICKTYKERANSIYDALKQSLRFQAKALITVDELVNAFDELFEPERSKVLEHSRMRLAEFIYESFIEKTMNEADNLRTEFRSKAVLIVADIQSKYLQKILSNISNYKLQELWNKGPPFKLLLQNYDINFSVFPDDLLQEEINEELDRRESNRRQAWNIAKSPAVFVTAGLGLLAAIIGFPIKNYLDQNNYVPKVDQQEASISSSVTASSISASSISLSSASSSLTVVPSAPVVSEPKPPIEKPKEHLNGNMPKMSKHSDNTNFYGSDFRFEYFETPDDCRVLCQTFSECRAYTFVIKPSGPGTCWLKDAVPMSIPQVGTTSGIKLSRLNEGISTSPKLPTLTGVWNDVNYRINTSTIESSGTGYIYRRTGQMPNGDSFIATGTAEQERRSVVINYKAKFGSGNASSGRCTGQIVEDPENELHLMVDCDDSLLKSYKLDSVKNLSVRK